MAQDTLMAVFTSRRDAEGAHATLLNAGFAAGDLAISADFTDDAIAAEMPGQAFENQTGAEGTGLAAWVKSMFASVQDTDTADAKRMADIQRGGAVLTVTAVAADLKRASELIVTHGPITVRHR